MLCMLHLDDIYTYIHTYSFKVISLSQVMTNLYQQLTVPSAWQLNARIILERLSMEGRDIDFDIILDFRFKYIVLLLGGMCVFDNE